MSRVTDSGKIWGDPDGYGIEAVRLDTKTRSSGDEAVTVRNAALVRLPTLPGRLNTPLPKALIILGGALGTFLVLCCGVGAVASVFSPSGKPSPTASTTTATRGGTAPAIPAVVTSTAVTPSLTSSAATTTSAATPTNSTTSTAAPPPPPPPPKPKCDPNYSGACVPIASDVDCTGGSGDGPAYVQGPVYVIGRDIYGLDRDGNGIGCET
jgi:hypothetical protein